MLERCWGTPVVLGGNSAPRWWPVLRGTDHQGAGRRGLLDVDKFLFVVAEDLDFTFGFERARFG